MKFEEALKHLLQGRLIQIEGCKWCLVINSDKNLEVECIYISTNDYAQAWNPQAWQLRNENWKLI